MISSILSNNKSRQVDQRTFLAQLHYLVLKGVILVSLQAQTSGQLHSHHAQTNNSSD